MSVSSSISEEETSEVDSQSEKGRERQGTPGKGKEPVAFNLIDDCFGDSTEDPSQYLKEFIKTLRVYDTVPSRCQAMVLDVELPIFVGISAMCDYKTDVFLTLDALTSQTVGMFTLADVIEYIVVSGIDTHSLNWLLSDYFEKRKGPRLTKSYTTLDKPLELLKKERVHIVPVLHYDQDDQLSGNFYASITAFSIVVFLVQYLRGPLVGQVLDRMLISDLDLLTTEDLISASPSDSFLSVVELLHTKNIGAIPIVNERGYLFCLTRSHVLELLGIIFSGLEVSFRHPLEVVMSAAQLKLDEILLQDVHGKVEEADISLCECMSRLVSSKFRRLIFLTPEGFVRGILTSHDLLPIFI